MKKTLILLSALLCMSAVNAQEKTKIACVGNSITYGAGIKDRGNDSYPSVLNRLLGTDKYEVRNFGVSARTLLSKGDHPYINEQAYRDAKAFNPDIVTIKLGTNDTKPHNWKYNAELKEDLRALVKSFQELPSNPTVYLCYPIPATNLSWGINDSTSLHHIIPCIAEVAKEMDILTVGIVTIPFAFEGAKKIKKAMIGVAQLAEHVDAILVINNEKLRQIYPDFNFLNAFSKSDDVVANAARSIAEIITVPGYINTDFADVYNTLKNGNVAIMSVGSASGEKRIEQSIHEAMHSPLVNSDVKGAKRILLQLYCSTEHPIIMQEMDHIHAFVHEVGEDVEVQWGVSLDESLGEKVRVTLIATGYDVSDIPGLNDAVGKKTVDEAIDSFYGEKTASEEKTQEQEPVEEQLAATEQSPMTEMQDGDIVISLDDDIELHIADPKPASQPVVTPRVDESKRGLSNIAGWMRGRRS